MLLYAILDSEVVLTHAVYPHFEDLRDLLHEENRWKRLGHLVHSHDSVPVIVDAREFVVGRLPHTFSAYEVVTAAVLLLALSPEFRRVFNR